MEKLTYGELLPGDTVLVFFSDGSMQSYLITGVRRKNTDVRGIHYVSFTYLFHKSIPWANTVTIPSFKTWPRHLSNETFVATFVSGIANIMLVRNVSKEG